MNSAENNNLTTDLIRIQKNMKQLLNVSKEFLSIYYQVLQLSLSGL